MTDLWFLTEHGKPAIWATDQETLETTRRPGQDVIHYIPAPTWRPIAEMPPEWRDGRAVLCLLPGGDCGGVDPDPVCLRYEGVNWYDDTVTARCPVLYLDLAIPEVPRG